MGAVLTAPPFEAFGGEPSAAPSAPQRGGSLRRNAFPAAFFAFLALISIVALRRADTRVATPQPFVAVMHPPEVRLAGSARGLSGGVRMRFALPGGRVDLPLEVQQTPTGLAYQWVALGAPGRADSARALANTMRAPDRPGFYRLSIVGEGGHKVVDGVTLAVLVPFSSKRGSSLNGYRIGFYRNERRGDAPTVPTGFLEIAEEHSDLPVTEHLSLADFITHDAQTMWPRYAALDPRILDKLELVFAEIASWKGIGNRRVDVDVHSGFRTPLHNRSVLRAASDSRHQYGDAADVAIDANADGRVTAKDLRLVELAVEIVEREHPELVGGLGIYTRNGAPYAHIDTRGSRVRWQD